MEGPPPRPLGGGDDSASSSHRRTSPIAIKSIPSTAHNNVILSPAGAFTAAFEVTDFNLDSSCSEGSPHCAAASAANNTPCVSLGPWNVYLMLDANNNLFIKALDTETAITSWKQISKTVRVQHSFEPRPLALLFST